MSFTKKYLPPILKKKLTGLLYGWSGNYLSWKEAEKKSSGYDSDIIFKKVKQAALKVKNGEAVYERDSVIFDKVHYSFPLLSALSLVALKNNNKLNVLDFGGSLGSSYYQNRFFFTDLPEFTWNVVEQEHFVTEGQKNFADKHLHFYFDIDSCLNERPINVILLSSVLQYMEKPYELLEKLISNNIEFVIIDRAPLLLEGMDRITIQKVPSSIYKAKYPCWLLNEKNILKKFLEHYDLLFESETEESININKAAFKTFFFKRKR